MGLDMYVFRFTPAEIDRSKVYTYDEIQDMGYDLYDGQYINEPWMKEMMKVSKPYEVMTTYWDLDKIQKEFGLSKKPDWCGFSPGVNHFSTDKGVIDIKTSEAPRFTAKKINTFWVCKKQQVAYWRERDDIREAIFRYIGKKVENVGYYKITPRVIARIAEMGIEGFNLDFVTNQNNLYYHEWY